MVAAKATASAGEGTVQGLGAMCVVFVFFAMGLFFTVTGIHMVIKESKIPAEDRMLCNQAMGIVLIVLGIAFALGVSSLF